MTNDDGRLQYRCLERKALLAQSGDTAAVRELAIAAVEFNGTAGAPAAVLDQFEERFVRAELKYRTDNKNSIPVEAIVRAVNNLAQKLHAPDYAKTDVGEVEVLRVASRSEMPHFISSGGKAMSPLEAAYLVHLLIYQKILNETFLVPPAERTSIERGSAPARTTIQANQPQTVTIDPRVKEMLALARNVGLMRITDLIAIGQAFLDDLGIDR